MITYTISDWTIDGDEAHAHIIGKRENGEHVEEVTLSRAHDAPGWTIEGREGEVYDTPNHALEQLEHEASADDEDEDDRAGHVNEPIKPYGGQAPFLTLILKNETTGDEWTHPIGRQDASDLSEWWADQSEYQRQDLPFEVEETVSRIVTAYAEAENEDDPRPMRPATADEIRAYLLAQSGTVTVEIDDDDRRVHCQCFNDEAGCPEWWVHSHADEWTVTTEGGHTWLRGPNGLGWIIKNEDPLTHEELSRQLHGIEAQEQTGG